MRWFLLVVTVWSAGCDSRLPPDDDIDETDAPTTDDTDPADTTDDTDDTDEAADTAAPPDRDPVIQTCLPLPEPPSGVCEVTAGTGAGLWLRGVVLAPDRVLEGGSVFIDGDGLITCVDCDCSDAEGANTATVVTCPEGVISPGLINPHEHTTFSEAYPFPPSATRYEHRHGWRKVLSTPSNPHGTGTTQAGNRMVELRHMMAGTTTMVGSGYARGMVRNPDGNDLLGPGMPRVDNSTFPLGDSGRTFKADCGWSYDNSESEIAEMDFYLPHVAEGIDNYAAEEFRCHSRSADGGIDAVEPNVAHIHGMGLQASDYYQMAAADTKLVWSPRSNVSLYGHTANVRLMHTLGGTIALGTDWSYTGSATLLRELRCADELNQRHYNRYFTDADLWKMVTVNAAASIGAPNAVGSLKAGALGDIAIFDGREARAHAAVVRADSQDVWMVLRSGTPLFGDADTLAAMGSTCSEALVCGQARQVCTDTEWSLTFEQMLQSAPGGYPVTYCDDTPPLEPTCVPSRPGEFTGAITADDPDGDGIPTAQDACPRVFDPIRPIDGGAQPDADQDGFGDACDFSPISPDLDGDGVINMLDVCPVNFDDQADADADLKGDACDACANTANPERGCP